MIYLQRRFWRKNRQPNPGSRCIGTDGNRNFNVSYGTIGFSNNPCSEIYNGRGPMSERESIAMSEFLGKFTNTRLFLSFHSFGQLLLLPYVSNKYDGCTTFSIKYEIMILNFFFDLIKGFKRNPSPNHEHLVSQLIYIFDNESHVNCEYYFRSIDANRKESNGSHPSSFRNIISFRVNVHGHL